MEIKQGIKNC